MVRRLRVSLLLLTAAVSSVAPATARAADAAPPSKPNVVLIFADDLGHHDVSFNGRKEWQTPHLDQLAAQGTVFRRFYTASVVCAPSRAALMTGRYSIHNGVTGNGSYDLPAAEVTIAEALKKEGYATGLFGKWHAGAKRPGTKNFTHPMDQGFDEFYGFTSARHAWDKFPKELWDGREMKPVADGGYADNLFATRAIDFVQRHKDKPFFLYLPFTAPHSRIEATPEDVAEHQGKFKEDPSKPYQAIYAALVTRMDKEVGRVMKTLDDLKLADNTIVVFTSDHGATFEVLQMGAASALDSNHPFRGQKRTLWEGGTRVPGLIRWPGKVPAGTESHTPISTIDVLPTVLAAAGAQPDPATKIDGTNLLPHLTQQSPAPDRTLFWEWDEGGATYFAAMRGDLKLMISGSNRPELYNVATDPAERRDISAEHPKLVKQLKSELDAWLATTSDAAKQKKNASPGEGEEEAAGKKVAAGKGNATD